MTSSTTPQNLGFLTPELIDRILPHLRHSEQQLEQFVTSSWTQKEFVRNAVHVRELHLQLEQVLDRLVLSAPTTHPSEPETHGPLEECVTSLITNLCFVSINLHCVMHDLWLKIVALCQLNPGIRRLHLFASGDQQLLPSLVAEHLPNLQELCLSGSWHGDVKALLESLPDCIRTVQLEYVHHCPTTNGDLADEGRPLLLVGPTVVKRHHTLETLHIEGHLGNNADEILVPFLESCSHRLQSLKGLGSTFFTQRRIVNVLLKIGFVWKVLYRLHPSRCLSDAGLAEVISCASSQWTEIYLSPTMVGPLTLAAIANHCSHLTILDVAGNILDKNEYAWLGLGVQGVLRNASRLKTLKVYRFIGKNRITADNILSSEWATRSLEVLNLKIAVPRADDDDDDDDDDNNDSAPSDVTVSRELLCTIQRQILRRIGQQKSLMSLILGARGAPWLTKYHQRNCLEMTLESGLDELAGLHDLEVLDIQFMDHRVAVPELEWMAENLPKLQHLRGVSNRLRPPSPEVLQWLQTNKPSWMTN
ncbi:hypothetical protein DFQ27_005674 [Actinomortierella ambigua]|uniref:F-box domain-containing protein n=1 Tax=Actinomortierella ambigua TaxID=1343610 RepID=A0A9P6U2N1_9FUNG|nr:hypothetical protein DFQ27_005674 [Actinomortierella ambigua]